jgi:hypothetical protein
VVRTAGQYMGRVNLGPPPTYTYTNIRSYIGLLDAAYQFSQELPVQLTSPLHQRHRCSCSSFVCREKFESYIFGMECLQPQVLRLILMISVQLGLSHWELPKFFETVFLDPS